MDKLKPCPFCRGEADSKMYLWGSNRITNDMFWRFYVFCTKCNAMSDNVFESEEKAVEAWNHRCKEE